MLMESWSAGLAVSAGVLTVLCVCATLKRMYDEELFESPRWATSWFIYKVSSTKYKDIRCIDSLKWLEWVWTFSFAFLKSLQGNIRHVCVAIWKNCEMDHGWRCVRLDSILVSLPRTEDGARAGVLSDPFSNLICPHRGNINNRTGVFCFFLSQNTIVHISSDNLNAKCNVF